MKGRTQLCYRSPRSPRALPRQKPNSASPTSADIGHRVKRRTGVLGRSLSGGLLPAVYNVFNDARAHKARWNIYMPADRETVTFDYGVPAELLMAKRKGGPRQRLRYRRFATAAEAIRFAVEELPAVRALGAWMQVGDERFDGDDIQRLYESDEFPLQRRLSE